MSVAQGIDQICLEGIMDDAGRTKRHRSRSPRPSQHKSVKKKSAPRHRGDSSSPSPPRRRSTLSKYNAEISRKDRKKGKRKLSRSSSSSSSSSPERKKRKKKAAKSSPSSSSSSSSSSSDSSSSSSSSSDESSDSSKHKRRHKKKKCRRGKKKKTLKKKSKKVKKKSLSKVKILEGKSSAEEAHHGPSLELHQKESMEDIGPAVLTDEQKTRIQAMKPMTKEEWDARQSVIRRVVDPETGRMRLIKGDGEVLEEIVSRDKHRDINKQATANDGFTFQMRSGIL
ncbi:ADP-ribosylation factor-like protein 6-interacting protein 4 isoform 3-T3 [Mantella aurantiaca]